MSIYSYYIHAPSVKLTDEKLYELCEKYGAAARLWRQKFAGLLPEVFKRGIYRKKGFGSIHEFAAKLAGMSERHVDTVLRLEKKFEDKPILKHILEEGEVSIYKLLRVASVATPENESLWATQVRLLPKSALETLVRDERHESLPGHHAADESDILQELGLSGEVQRKLRELKDRGIDINVLLMDFLEERELKIAQKKEKLSVEVKQADSRYIPAETRKILQEEYGEKCSITTCRKSSEETHHTQRFSLSQNHDPKFLAPLCRDHHVIAHSIDLQYHRARVPA